MTQRELSEIDELVEIEDRTNDDGTVNVTIEGWEKLSETEVEVTFEVIDSTESERMRWPNPGGDLTDYKFYRLVNQAGLEMRNADLLDGEAARAKNSGSDWFLDVPEKKTVQEKATSNYTRVVSELKAVSWARVIITWFWIVSVLAIIGTVIALL